MTKLYITGLPDSPGMTVVRALRDALIALEPDEAHAPGYSYASDVLAQIQQTTGPYLLAVTDDVEAIKAARLALSEAGVACAQDLPEYAHTAPPAPEPPAAEPVSYNAARIALVAMRLSAGEPAMALHHCILLANAAGETPQERGTCMEAASILLDVFPPTLLSTIREVITHYTGIEAETETEDES